jgi:aldose 1-epimerase
MSLLRLSILISLVTLISVVGIEAKPKVKKEFYGKTADGKSVEQFTLTNSSGSEAKIITFGGIITSLKVPDKNGQFGNIVLGYDNLQGYESDSFYLGALIGRYANRIGNAQFTLNGKTYNLAKNNGENNLHGGPKGYHKVVWTGRSFVDKNGANLELKYLSKDGEEGFPSNLNIKVIYTLTENNELKVDYFAVPDNDTIVNLTQHSYFNLAGKGDILSHQLQINSEKYTPTDQGAIPGGEFKNVKGTPFDFNNLTEIGKRINDQDQQLIFGKGYDHNWVLNKKGKELNLAAKVFETTSGRLMEVWTTEPGLQFYAGNFLTPPFTYRGAMCLEAQNFPDSPNKKNFPSPILKKGKTYRQTTIYKFAVKK